MGYADTRARFPIMGRHDGETKTMIDEDRTMQLFGYTSDKPYWNEKEGGFICDPKNRKIVAVCDGCGRYRIVAKYTYKDLCASCKQLERKKLPEPEFVHEDDRFIEGTGIDRIETIKELGYDPIHLSIKSSKKIVAKCLGCGKYRTITKHAYRELCGKCKLNTPETKKRMSIASSRPRGPMSQERRDNMSKARLGKKRGPMPQKQKDKISKSKKGKGTKLKGQPKSLEYRQNLSAVNLGIPREEWIGFSDSNRPHVLPMGQCIKVNQWFVGSHAHHITKSIVVYIPGELHNHIPHNIKTGIGMEEINTTAMQYVNGGIDV